MGIEIKSLTTDDLIRAYNAWQRLPVPQSETDDQQLFMDRQNAWDKYATIRNLLWTKNKN